ncbi:hypothetical protein JZ751_019749 [Albula glossodonta]|uniref:Neuronal acetylcholine receptor subunit alpha-7 n=1 Tax=Albula glossodonta TaxID=121402 RepID=A0A8T2MUG1_9TELE|nr:hypothetical protein JZ751_019749 [Albula glossodonta]
MGKCSFVFHLVWITSWLDVSQQGAPQHRLYSDLMKNYNPQERPVVNDSENLTVHFSIHLIQILDVDEKNQVLTTNIWLNMHWIDQYLQWNTTEYSDISNIRLPDDQIWKPDILLYNRPSSSALPPCATGKAIQFSAAPCVQQVRPSSSALPPCATGKAIQFNAAPMCNRPSSSALPPCATGKAIQFSAATCVQQVRPSSSTLPPCATGKPIQFSTAPVCNSAQDRLDATFHSNVMVQSSGFCVYVPPEVVGRREEKVYACCTEPYPSVVFTVVMRRRTLFYVLNLLLPCLLISVMALLVFLLPADSGEKISLGITVLLSLTVFMLLVAEIMPATSDTVPLIGESSALPATHSKRTQYFASIMVTVGLSIISTVLVLQCHHHHPEGSNMPKWMQVVFLKWGAWFLRMRRPEEERVQLACYNKRLGVSLEDPRSTTAPLSASPTKSSAQYGEEEALLPGAAPHGSSRDPDIGRILEELRYVVQRFRKQDRGEIICSEWKFAAAVLDRLCLITFSLVIVLCTLAILLSAPNCMQAISKDFFT